MKKILKQQKKREYEPLPCDKEMHTFCVCWEDGPTRINSMKGKPHWEFSTCLLSGCSVQAGFSI